MDGQKRPENESLGCREAHCLEGVRNNSTSLCECTPRLSNRQYMTLFPPSKEQRLLMYVPRTMSASAPNVNEALCSKSRVWSVSSRFPSKEDGSSNGLAWTPSDITIVVGVPLLVRCRSRFKVRVKYRDDSWESGTSGSCPRPIRRGKTGGEARPREDTYLGRIK